MPLDDFTERNGPDPKVMNRSYLIQRVKRPNPPRAGSKVLDLVFNAFGGGYKDGGLSKEVMALLRQVWEFDYMGATEFELGSVPSALNRMRRDVKDFQPYMLAIPEDQVAKGHRPREKDFQYTGAVFLFCHREEKEEITKRIRAFAEDEHGEEARKQRSSEHIGLSEALRGDEDKFGSQCVGWLEINNGYFFTTDERMFAGLLNLFGKPFVAEG